MDKQSRFKSKVLWTSLISAAILIMQNVGIIDIDKADTFTNVGQIILGVLVTAGILNDPTNKNGF